MEEKQPINISDLRNESRLFITDTFPAPPVILKVDNSVVGTLGNFSASTGKAKSKKTFNVCAIVAAALINNSVLKYKASLPDNKNRILYVDTEQSPYHCKEVLTRILLMANLPLDRQPDKLEFLSLRKYPTKLRVEIIEEAISSIIGLGLVIIDGIRDLAYDINSPSEATDLITKLMQWTDEKQIHIHTVLHLNKGDDNTRGHLGTELNNKAEAVLQITKDDVEKDISMVEPRFVRLKDFEPFAFRINDDSLPELVEDYQVNFRSNTVKFDYNEVSEANHRKALENLFSEKERFNYAELISMLQKSYGITGYKFGINKAKKLKTFLENKRMILKEGSIYKYNPDFYY